MPFFFFDPTMIFLIPGILFSLYASSKVRSTYNKFKQVPSRRGITGKEVARLILQNNGINDVEIERTDRMLSDHYDPRTKTLRLSPENYEGKSLAAAGVSAHEVGHAIQHAQEYGPLNIRTALVPVSRFGSWLAMPLVIIGMLFSHPMLIDFGIYLFSAVVFFTLVTLPVEFNASSRALVSIEGFAILDKDETEGARKVLNAAALTYVAAAAVAVLQLLRLILIRGYMDR